MPIIRRSAGLGTLLFSSLGLLLCIACIIALLLAKPHVDRINTALFATADDAFVFMQTKLDRVQQILGNSRDRITSLSALAEQLKTADTPAPPQIASLGQTLDDLLAQLQLAQHWLDSSQAIATGIHRLSQAIVMSEMNDTDHPVDTADTDPPQPRVTGQRIMEFSATVAQVLAKLDLLQQELAHHRERRTLARELAGTIINHIADLDERLTRVTTRIRQFNIEISAARSASIQRGQTTQTWITFTTFALAFLFLWFAMSQINMLCAGYRLAQNKTWRPEPTPSI